MGYKDMHPIISIIEQYYIDVTPPEKQVPFIDLKPKKLCELLDIGLNRACHPLTPTLTLARDDTVAVRQFMTALMISAFKMATKGSAHPLFASRTPNNLLETDWIQAVLEPATLNLLYKGISQTLSDPVLMAYSPRLLNTRTTGAIYPVDDANVLEAQTRDKAGLYFTSRSLTYPRTSQLLQEGQAQLTSFANLLTYAFHDSLSDQPVSLLRIMTETPEVSCKLFTDVGFSTEQTTELHDQADALIQRERNGIATHRESGMLLFPVRKKDQTDYIALEPVIHNGSMVHYAQAMREMQVPSGWRVFTNGNNRKNAGRLSSLIGHGVPVLNSLPRNARRMHDISPLQRIRAVKSVFDIGQNERDIRRALASARLLAEQTYQNDNIRMGTDRHLQVVIDGLMQLARECADEVCEMPVNVWSAQDHPLAALSPLEKRWIDYRNRTTPLEKTEIQTVVNAYCALLTPIQQDIVINDDLHTRLRQRLYREVACF
jgi:hypothetical protein